MAGKAHIERAVPFQDFNNHLMLDIAVVPRDELDLLHAVTKRP